MTDDLDLTGDPLEAAIVDDEVDEVEIETRFLGLVEVDSGTLLIGDPAYALPNREQGKPGIDYSAVVEADSEEHATALDGQPVLLVSNFGGDGTFPVFGEFEDGELVRLIVNLFEPEEE